MDHSCRPLTHLRTKVNSSRRRCARCRSAASIFRICDHAQGCSKYPIRHSSRLSLMAASLDCRAAISVSTCCRSTFMSVAPAASFAFGWPRRPSDPRKSNWPWQTDARANAEPMPAGGAWGRRVLIEEQRTQARSGPSILCATLRRDNLELWLGCQIASPHRSRTTRPVVRRSPLHASRDLGQATTMAGGVVHEPPCLPRARTSAPVGG
jgi:hypothetical protein